MPRTLGNRLICADIKTAWAAADEIEKRTGIRQPVKREEGGATVRVIGLSMREALAIAEAIAQG